MFLPLLYAEAFERAVADSVVCIPRTSHRSRTGTGLGPQCPPLKNSVLLQVVVSHCLSVKKRTLTGRSLFSAGNTMGVLGQRLDRKGLLEKVVCHADEQRHRIVLLSV